MSKFLKSLLACCLITMQVSVSCPTDNEDDKSLKLWYEQPADEWMKAVPVGNGRLGAMIYGGVETETIALNEITLWSGQYDEQQESPCGKEELAKIRKLFFEGKYEEGNNLASKLLVGTPHSFGSHVPVGDLTLKFDHNGTAAANYHRELDLTDATAKVLYRVGNVTYKREYLCSNPDNILIFRLSANKKRKLSFGLSMNMLRVSDSTVFVATHNGLEFSGKVNFPKYGPGGVRFAGKITVLATGGNIRAEGSSLQVNNADEATIIVDIRTDYKDPGYKAACKATVDRSAVKGFDKVKKDHIADYKRLFDRVELSLGMNNARIIPTDLRWQRIKAGEKDPSLDALFFQYGRYLLIASSRENSPLPSNLQGLWNDNLACNMGWTCDYHLDINIEQNYWLSNITNLHECNTPLFNYIHSLATHGTKTAQVVYGSPGWVAHTVANAWGYTAPGASAGWGLFPTAGAWIASHLWTHYEYTKDRAFLEKTGYPILKESALFYLDYMVVHPNNGYLMTGPSTSPENSFRHGGTEMSLSMMPTCDRVLVYETYMSCIKASEILGIDACFRQLLEDALTKFPPIQISSKTGTIQEWFEDFELAHPNHRHSSHMLALYPFSQISQAHTPDLARAARKSIYNQINSDGFEDVEWSRANMINFYARLKEPVEAYKSVAGLLNTFTRENLLTISPKGIAGAPWDIFIIDGNAAGTSGIAEMLLQSHEGYIEFLPALPEQWNTGYFRGLCVRGGAEVDVQWTNSVVKKATITATFDNTFKVKLPDSGIVKIKRNGVNEKLDVGIGNLITCSMKKGDRIELNY